MRTETLVQTLLSIKDESDVITGFLGLSDTGEEFTHENTNANTKFRYPNLGLLR